MENRLEKGSEKEILERGPIERPPSLLLSVYKCAARQASLLSAPSSKILPSISPRRFENSFCSSVREGERDKEKKLLPSNGEKKERERRRRLIEEGVTSLTFLFVGINGERAAKKSPSFQRGIVKTRRYNRLPRYRR